ncbi:CD1375 family protein [Fusibacter sp. JL298sf-3]
MAQVYFKLIKAGSRTIEQVPENLRLEVQALLDAGAASN